MLFRNSTRHQIYSFPQIRNIQRVTILLVTTLRKLPRNESRGS